MDTQEESAWQTAGNIVLRLREKSLGFGVQPKQTLTVGSNDLPRSQQVDLVTVSLLTQAHLSLECPTLRPTLDNQSHQ